MRDVNVRRRPAAGAAVHSSEDCAYRPASPPIDGNDLLAYKAAGFVEKQLVCRGYLGWGLLAVACFAAIASDACMGVSTSQVRPVIIQPAAAAAIARAGLTHRIEWINKGDLTSLRATETPPLLTVDEAYTRLLAVTKQPAPMAVVTSLQPYVTVQRSYPAAFTAVLGFRDGTGAILGFTRADSMYPWRMAVYVEIKDGTRVPIALGSDGYATRAYWVSPFPYDPAALLAWSENQDCARRTGCVLDPLLRCCPPAGYRADAVSAPVEDGGIATQGAYMKGFSDRGFEVTFGARPEVAFDFPVYQLSSGEELEFVGVKWQTDVRAPDGECLVVPRRGRYVNPEMPAGRFQGVAVINYVLSAVRLPPNRRSGTITEIGGLGVLLGDQVPVNLFRHSC